MSMFQKEIEGAARMINELDPRQLEVFVSAIEPKTIANILASMMPEKFAEISKWFEVVHPQDWSKVPGPFATTKQNDMVDHPAHYGGADNPYEAIKVIDAWKLGFALGNVVKYIARARHKGSELEDLKKAAWYLNHEIEKLDCLSGPSIVVKNLGGLPVKHAYQNNDVNMLWTACGVDVTSKDAIMCGPASLDDIDCAVCRSVLGAVLGART